MNIELLSIHVPKCGGTSFRSALQTAYGESLFQDYDDHVTDPAAPINMDPDGWLARSDAQLPQFLAGKVAVHGHFNYRKYRCVPASLRFAVIREPLPRLVSHYFYWMTMPRGTNRLHHYMLDNRLDIEAFARLPTIRYLYSRVYFGGIELGDLDFVGLFEEMPAVIRRVEQDLGRRLNVGEENRNDSAEYLVALAELRADHAKSDRIRALLDDDIRFFERCRARWHE